jgi:hypothetical protein
VTSKYPEFERSGGFGEQEETILAYLYAHPEEMVSTNSIAQNLYPERYASEQEEAVKDTQHGIETLLVAKLVKGKRVSTGGMVTHVKLSLTPKGEAEAIKQQRMVKKIIIDIPRPQRKP